MRPDSIAEVLRRAVVDRGYTAYALGRQTGVAPHVISKFLAGERGLNLETLERLASHLDLHLVERAPAGSDPAETRPPAGAGVSPSVAGPPGDLRTASPKRGRTVTYNREKMSSILIFDGDERIEIVVLDIRGDKVRLGVEGSGSTSVSRQELWASLRREGP